MSEDRKEKALRAIQAITDAWGSGRVVVRSDINGYHKDAIGLDVFVALIVINLENGLYGSFYLKGEKNND